MIRGGGGRGVAIRNNDCQFVFVVAIAAAAASSSGAILFKSKDGSKSIGLETFLFLDAISI